MMTIKHYEMTQEEQAMLIEVINKTRFQDYTPERLCDLQKITNAQYYYWWMNDLKIEEYGKTLFVENLNAYHSDFGPYKTCPLGVAKNAKYCNSFLNTLHMGHNPMVWFMDDDHARGVFLFEGYLTYLDDPQEKVELFLVYCNDFVKKEDGQWYIDKFRMINIKADGGLRPETTMAPKGYDLENWKKI